MVWRRETIAKTIPNWAQDIFPSEYIHYGRVIGKYTQAIQAIFVNQIGLGGRFCPSFHAEDGVAVIHLVGPSVNICRLEINVDSCSIDNHLNSRVP